jgi:uncharacterized protein (TIGR00255 family)
MTGFASVSRESGGAHVNVTIKSVNHRFLDVGVKLPHSLAAIEAVVRAQLQQKLTRGRVELSLAAEVTTPPDREVVIDEALLEQIAGAFASVRARGLVGGPLTPADVLRMPQVVEIRTRATEASAGVPAPLAALVETAVSDAIEALVGMRATEGGYLAADLDARLATVAGFVSALEREGAEGQRQVEGKLRERIAAMPADLQGEPAAVAQEIVRMVARSDIDEEIVRLRAHLEHWRRLADGPEPCGRKLDFLVQEMNREVNTIGSKVEGVKATETVIAAKAELERLKEQVQNVE